MIFAYIMIAALIAALLVLSFLHCVNGIPQIGKRLRRPNFRAVSRWICTRSGGNCPAGHQ